MSFTKHAFLLISFWSITSCHSSRKLTTDQISHNPINYDKITVDSVLQRIANNQDIKYYTAKGDIRYADSKQDVDGSIQINAVRDSAYVIILKKLGIEVARILLNQDSIHLLDRFNQEYTSRNIDAQISKYQIPLDFYDIHSLLTTGCFVDRSANFKFSRADGKLSLNANSSIASFDYALDSLTLLPRVFDMVYKNQLLKVESKNTTSVAGKHWPANLRLKATDSKGSTLHLEIIWDEISTVAEELRFVIPEHYAKDRE